MPNDRRPFRLFCLCLLPVLVWSWFNPFDRLTWWLEVAPVLLGVPLAGACWNRFPLSRLLLVLLWVHAVILIVGGHYTYARVPLFDWIRDWTGGDRNNYDKVGHFVQGFVPAILTREILLRNSPLAGSRWLPFLTGCVCLAFSAFYELIEWVTALASGSAADDFLGTQGYVWDTQSDMALALLGATLALLVLPRFHDASLQRLASRPASAPKV